MGLLPTPVASDATTGAIIGKEDTFVMTGSGTFRKINRNGTDGSVGLARSMSLLIPPSASDAIRSTMTMDALRKGNGNGNLSQQIAHNIGGGTSQLNPLFVEEMMGFPSMWSVLPFLSQNGGREQSKDTETR